MGVTAYFIAGIIAGFLIGISVALLKVTNSPDKNCFLFEPKEQSGGYASSSTQSGLGIASAIIGGFMALAGLVGGLSNP